MCLTVNHASRNAAAKLAQDSGDASTVSTRSVGKRAAGSGNTDAGARASGGGGGAGPAATGGGEGMGGDTATDRRDVDEDEAWALQIVPHGPRPRGGSKAVGGGGEGVVKYGAGDLRCGGVIVDGEGMAEEDGEEGGESGQGCDGGHEYVPSSTGKGSDTRGGIFDGMEAGEPSGRARSILRTCHLDARSSRAKSGAHGNLFSSTEHGSHAQANAHTTSLFDNNSEPALHAGNASNLFSHTPRTAGKRKRSLTPTETDYDLLLRSHKRLQVHHDSRNAIMANQRTRLTVADEDAIRMRQELAAMQEERDAARRRARLAEAENDVAMERREALACLVVGVVSMVFSGWVGIQVGRELA